MGRIYPVRGTRWLPRRHSIAWIQTSCFIDEPLAAKSLSELWGFPSDIACVRLEPFCDVITVEVERGGDVLFEDELVSPEPTTGADIFCQRKYYPRWDRRESQTCAGRHGVCLP